MGDSTREAWITGIGIVSCLGEGPDAHWQALSAGHIKVDAKTFAPYLVHPLAPLELDKQIPKKGDQRQMEPSAKSRSMARSSPTGAKRGIPVRSSTSG